MLEVDCDNGLRHQELETLLPPTLEDEADSPTLKRVAVLLKRPPLPPTLEDVEDRPTLKRVPVLLKQIVLLPIVEDLAGADSRDLPSTRPNTLVHRFQHKNTRRTAAIMLLLVLIASGAIGVVLISRQNAALGGLTGQVTSFANSKILLGLCIILAIAFTVGFNIISRISLSTTRHEPAYTILW
jgi:hypothetical protein